MTLRTELPAGYEFTTQSRIEDFDGICEAYPDSMLFTPDGIIYVIMRKKKVYAEQFEVASKLEKAGSIVRIALHNSPQCMITLKEFLSPECTPPYVTLVAGQQYYNRRAEMKLAMKEMRAYPLNSPTFIYWLEKSRYLAAQCDCTKDVVDLHIELCRAALPPEEQALLPQPRSLSPAEAAAEEALRQLEKGGD